MGSIISSQLDSNMKKQQEFMQENGRLQLERQIQMQNQMRERQVALMIARGRELCNWWLTFYAIAAPTLILGGIKKKNPALFAPLLPLTFIVGYQVDMAYGNKINRIREEADRIMDREAMLLEMPHGLPSYESVERGRIQQLDQDRLNQGHDFFL